MRSTGPRAAPAPRATAVRDGAKARPRFMPRTDRDEVWAGICRKSRPSEPVLPTRSWQCSWGAGHKHRKCLKSGRSQGQLQTAEELSPSQDVNDCRVTVTHTTLGPPASPGQITVLLPSPLPHLHGLVTSTGLIVSSRLAPFNPLSTLLLESRFSSSLDVQVESEREANPGFPNLTREYNEQPLVLRAGVRSLAASGQSLCGVQRPAVCFHGSNQGKHGSRHHGIAPECPLARYGGEKVG